MKVRCGKVSFLGTFGQEGQGLGIWSQVVGYWMSCYIVVVADDVSRGFGYTSTRDGVTPVVEVVCG